MRFSRQELAEFLIISLIFGFILSFNEWGTTSFDWIAGVQNWILATLIAAIGVWAHHAAQRYAGHKQGYEVEQKTWWYGMVGGLLLAFLTNGVAKILMATGTNAKVIKARRKGKYREGPNTSDIAAIAFAGPAACIGLAAVAKFLEATFAPGAEIFTKIVSFNMLFAVQNLLPLPPLDGSRILFGSRLWYATLFGLGFGMMLGLYVANVNVLASLALGVLVAIICWWLMYVFVE